MDSTGEEKAGFLEEATQLWGEEVLEPGGIIVITIHFQVSIVINQVVRYLYGASSLNICLIFDQEIFVRWWAAGWWFGAWFLPQKNILTNSTNTADPTLPPLFPNSLQRLLRRFSSAVLNAADAWPICLVSYDIRNYFVEYNSNWTKLNCFPQKWWELWGNFQPAEKESYQMANHSDFKQHCKVFHQNSTPWKENSEIFCRIEPFSASESRHQSPFLRR